MVGTSNQSDPGIPIERMLGVPHFPDNPHELVHFSQPEVVKWGLDMEDMGMGQIGVTKHGFFLVMVSYQIPS
jgi:hypothetical protein